MDTFTTHHYEKISARSYTDVFFILTVCECPMPPTLTDLLVHEHVREGRALVGFATFWFKCDAVSLAATGW